MARSDLPSTGDGKTGGEKPKRGQVTAKTKTGTFLWKQTTDMYAKPKPTKAAKATPAPAAEPAKRGRHRWFNSSSN